MGNHWPAVLSSARACSAALSAFNRSSTVCSNLRSSSIIWQNTHIHAYKWDAAQKKNKTKLVQFIFVLWTILQKKDLLLEKGRKKAWWTQHAINYTRLLLLKIQAWQNQVQNIMNRSIPWAWNLLMQKLQHRCCVMFCYYKNCLLLLEPNMLVQTLPLICEL